MWQGCFNVFCAYSFAFLFRPRSIEGCGHVCLFFFFFLTSLPHVRRGDGYKRCTLLQLLKHMDNPGSSWSFPSALPPGLVSATCERLQPGSTAAAENQRLTSISSMSQRELYLPSLKRWWHFVVRPSIR